MILSRLGAPRTPSTVMETPVSPTGPKLRESDHIFRIEVRNDFHTHQDGYISLLVAATPLGNCANHRTSSAALIT